MQSHSNHITSRILRILTVLLQRRRRSEEVLSLFMFDVQLLTGSIDRQDLRGPIRVLSRVTSENKPYPSDRAISYFGKTRIPPGGISCHFILS